MTRFVCATLLYGVLATLVLAAPLAASEQTQPPEPQEAVVETVAPPAEPEALAAAPEALPAEAPAAEAPAADPPVERAPPEPEPGPKERPVVAKAAPGTVTISDFEFGPASITVGVGDTVTWTNAGPTPHSATGDGFDTGIFEEGETRSQTFNEAGEFAYICTPHPNMKGTVIVRAAAAQPEDDAESPEAGSEAAGGGDSTAGGASTPTDSADVATLPATGIDAGGLFALGLMTLALGALLRRRTSGTG
jgi:LPXTG-motif cell wall-anchored protein